jgi:hypothetical protein
MGSMKIALLLRNKYMCLVLSEDLPLLEKTMCVQVNTSIYLIGNIQWFNAFVECMHEHRMLNRWTPYYSRESVRGVFYE